MRRDDKAHHDGQDGRQKPGDGAARNGSSRGRSQSGQGAGRTGRSAGTEPDQKNGPAVYTSGALKGLPKRGSFRDAAGTHRSTDANSSPAARGPPGSSRSAEKVISFPCFLRCSAARVPGLHATCAVCANAKALPPLASKNVTCILGPSEQKMFDELPSDFASRSGVAGYSASAASAAMTLVRGSSDGPAGHDESGRSDQPSPGFSPPDSVTRERQPSLADSDSSSIREGSNQNFLPSDPKVQEQWRQEWDKLQESCDKSSDEDIAQARRNDSDDDETFDEYVEELVGHVMGDEDAYGFIPRHPRHSVAITSISEEIESLPGCSRTNSVGDEQTGAARRQDLQRSRSVISVRPDLQRSGSFQSVTGHLTGDEVDTVKQTKSASFGALPMTAASEPREAKEQRRTFEWLALLKRILSKVLPRIIYDKIDRRQKAVLSILVTPAKRLERVTNISSKRVHFKLRRKAEEHAFNPYSKNNKMIQHWNFFMCLPRLLDLFMFGIRLAFVDLFWSRFVTVWIVDLCSEVVMLANMAIALITVVPKNTYPGQNHTANTLSTIATLYFRFEAAREWAGTILYHLASLVFFLLPHNEYHEQNANIYRWIWLASMLPRLARNITTLWKYKTESVVDPNVIKSISHFQMGFVGIVIFLMAEFIGCFYYFLARLVEFDDTTWIKSFEKTLPFYEHGVERVHNTTGSFQTIQESDFSSQFLLVIFKGFCRVASLGYDPGLPGNFGEMWFAVSVMVVSVFIVSLILGTVLTYVVRRDPMEVAHQQRLEALRIYMDKKHVPEDLYDNVVRYCEFQFKKSRQTGFSKDSDLIGSLSRSLRIEVANAYHGELMMRCSKIGRPLHKCSQQFLDEMVVRIYTIHVMPGDHIVHRDEIPRELFFVSSGAVQVVDEHDQVVSMIRSDVPDTAPIVGEVPFFLGINYLNAIKASLDGDVELQVLSKQSAIELAGIFPDDYGVICDNLWAQFGGQEAKEDDQTTLDKEKIMTKKRILDSANFKKMQHFSALCKAATSGDIDSIHKLANQGANLNQTDYDGEAPQPCLHLGRCLHACLCILRACTHRTRTSCLLSASSSRLLFVAGTHLIQH